MSSKFNSLFDMRCGILVTVLGGLTLVGATADAQTRQEVADGVIVNIADASLSKTIAIDRAKMAQTGPVTRVQVSFENLGKRAVNVQYRAQWMSSDGFEIPTNDRWEGATIDSQTTRSIDLLGNSRDISSVIINVKKQ